MSNNNTGPARRLMAAMDEAISAVVTDNPDFDPQLEIFLSQDFILMVGADPEIHFYLTQEDMNSIRPSGLLSAKSIMGHPVYKVVTPGAPDIRIFVKPISEQER